MKRQLVLSLILLLVAYLLSACSTSSTTATDPALAKHNENNLDESGKQTKQKIEAGSSNDQARVKGRIESDVAISKKPDGKIVEKKAGQDQFASAGARADRKREAREKYKSDIDASRVAENEVLQDRRVRSANTPKVLAKHAPRQQLLLSPITAPVGVASTVSPGIRIPVELLDREKYAEFRENPIILVAEKPVSTFSIDVDTGSYTNTRRILNEGRLPSKNVVRVEEFINYFNYDYPLPESKSTPFNVVTEVGPTPWNTATRLLHIGIKGYDVPADALPPANLVFLVDVSGSMRSVNKLPLLKKSLQMLTQKLRAQDKISLVVYAGASGTVLEPTSGANKAAILSALEGLSAGGSTNGAAGIRLAYLKAQQGFVPNGINRVILATDGDFNVGTTNFDALKSMVEQKRQTGIYLTTLGFGSGNYNDKLMEQIADVGNGNYAYVDSLMEAQKVLVTEIGSTLQTIAKDVKIQIEFNPAVVSEYRLVGYENRALRREDFNNDKIDAGEIGAGHTVTAIYEIALANQGGNLVDPLRYQSESSVKKKSSKVSNELAFLRLRYKHPGSNHSILSETPIQSNQAVSELDATSDHYKFAASVAGFAQLLRGGNFTKQYSYAHVVTMARASKGSDRFGYRSEFVRLVELANTLSGNASIPAMETVIKRSVN